MQNVWLNNRYDSPKEAVDNPSAEQTAQEVSEQEAKRFNEPKKQRFDHPEANYRWTDKEMHEAASVLAHDELYERSGDRDTRTEKKLLRFASDRSQRRAIAVIIAKERARAVELAKSDPDWPGKSEPHIETEEELRSRRRRLRFIPYGFLAAAALVAVVILATDSGDGNYTASVSTEERTARIDTISTTNRNGEALELSPENNEIPSRGDIITDEPIGKDGEAYTVTVIGEGEMSCSITDSDSGEEDRETGVDEVVCTVETD